MRKISILIVGILIFYIPNILFALTVYRYSPDTYTTISEGDNITFSIGVDDSYGLDFSEWYISANFQERHELSGYYMSGVASQLLINLKQHSHQLLVSL